MLFCGLLFSAELPVDGSFTKVKPDNTPVAWVLHPWAGYKPAAALAVKKEGKNNILTIRNAKAQYGTAVINAVRFKGLSGDTVRVYFKVRGKGEGSVSLHQYTKNPRKVKNSWNKASAGRYFTLTQQWTARAFNFTIEDGPNDETGSFAVCFGGNKNCEIDLSDIHIEHIKSPFRGNVRFPVLWRVFGPVDKNFVPKQAELTTFPETFAGKKPVQYKLINTRLAMRKTAGPGIGKCVWAFAEITAQVESDCTIGAGADWWMELYVNGQKIVDTMSEGNVKAPITIDNYVKTVRLKKGRNIIAAKVLSGAGGADLIIGGPNELRAQNKSVKLAKLNWIEDFDGKNISCSGNPRIIKGHPTPGLLTFTGQGVFSASKNLVIAPPESKASSAMPANNFAAAGVRIQNFGSEQRKDASLFMTAKVNKRRFDVEIRHKAASNLLNIYFIEDGKILSSQNIPYRVLPADFLFAADREGNWTFSVSSLADSSTHSFRGLNGIFTKAKNIRFNLELRNTGKTPAEIVIDNVLTGEAVPDNGILTVPYTIEKKADFDPVKAGWKLVFSDEFNGKELDLKKWFYSYNSNKKRLKLKDGKLVIAADWNKAKTKLESASIYTHQDFRYGYFEAKVKFRKEHGWWSAFWLCSLHPSNSFVDGMEIDVYEDYYLRSQVPGGNPGDTLDHNLHMFSGASSKSWNYHSKLPGSINDFYVIGCKWTPFEVSYYMNGKLIASSANHSPHNSVTFDAFYHGMGTYPLKGILSGCCGRSGGNPKNGKFPDQFEVDYLRIYAMPEQPGPEISVSGKGIENYSIPLGSTISFSADVKPSKKSRSPIKAVYLMDSGFLLDYKTQPPYNFDVKLTKEYYDTTHFVKPGRSRKAVELTTGIHAYAIVAQDANGNVSWSKPVVRFLCSSGVSSPRNGKAAAIPGRLMLSNYDDGGQGVAYKDNDPENLTDKSKTFRPGEWVDATATTVGHTHTGEWIKYTVDVKESGTYRATLHYGTPVYNTRDIILLVDGRIGGRFDIISHDPAKGFILGSYAHTDVKLNKGKNVLTLVFERGAINMTHIDFKLKK